MAADAKIIVDVEARLTKLEAGLAAAEGRVKRSSRTMDASFGAVAANGGGLDKIGRKLLGLGVIFRTFGGLTASFGQQIQANMINPTRTWSEMMNAAMDDFAKGMPIIGGMTEAIRGALVPGYTQSLQDEAARGESKAIDARISEAEFQRKLAETDDPIAKAKLSRDRESANIIRQVNAQRLEQMNLVRPSRFNALEKALLAENEAKYQAAVRANTSTTKKPDPLQMQGDPIASYGTAFGEYRVGPQGSMNPTAAAQKELVSETKQHRKETAKLARLAKQVANSLKGFN